MIQFDQFRDSFQTVQTIVVSIPAVQKFNDSIQTVQTFTDSLQTVQNIGVSVLAIQMFNDSIRPVRKLTANIRIRIRIRKSFIAKCVCAHKECVLVLGASSTESTNRQQCKQRQHIIKVIKNTNNEENRQ